MVLSLTQYENEMLEGIHGEDKQFAMTIITKVAEAVGAERLQEIRSAHVVDTLISGTGETGPEFARKLRKMQAKVAVPTTINVAPIDGHHTENNNNFQEYPIEVSQEVMDIYVEMGCQPTFTCSPFQEPSNQLEFGEHVCWGESSAVPYANSVFGARTNRYGQFITSAAAIAGRVPYSGVHLDENRKGQVLITLEDIPADWQDNNLFFHALGHKVGQLVGEKIPVVQGIKKDVSNDNLKAFGAATATSGGIAMFHILGVTPEAATLEEAFQHHQPLESYAISQEDIYTAIKDISDLEPSDKIDAVSFGAPHLSLKEVEEIYYLLEENNWQLAVPVYLSLSRLVNYVVEERGWVEKFDQADVTLVNDRCTYFPGIHSENGLSIMTDSSKWANYAPGQIDAKVAIGSFKDCVASAKSGCYEFNDFKMGW